MFYFAFVQQSLNQLITGLQLAADALVSLTNDTNVLTSNAPFISAPSTSVLDSVSYLPSFAPGVTNVIAAPTFAQPQSGLFIPPEPTGNLPLDYDATQLDASGQPQIPNFDESANQDDHQRRGIRRPVTGLTDAEFYWQLRMQRRLSRPAAKHFFCDMCKIFCVGDPSWTLHIEGRAHKLRERDQNASIELEECGGRVVAKVVPNKVDSDEIVLDQQQDWSNTASLESRLWFCDVCAVNCRNSTLFDLHIRGQKHEKRLKVCDKLGVEVSDSLKDALSRLETEKSSSKWRRRARRRGRLTVQPMEMEVEFDLTSTADFPQLRLHSEANSNTDTDLNPNPNPDPKRRRLNEPDGAESKLPSFESPVDSPVNSTLVATKQSTMKPRETEEGKSNAIVKPIAETCNLRIASLERTLQPKPVGEKYLVEIVNKFGAFICFKCKLCECDVLGTFRPCSTLRSQSLLT